MPALLRQSGQIEHQNAAGVAGGDIVMDVGIVAVLDLDPRDILHRDRIADDDVARLADIDARIRRAAHHRTVDQHMLALDRVDAIGAVGRARFARPFDLDGEVDDAVGALRFDAVALAVAYTEIAQHDIVAGDHQPLTRALLAREIERRRIHACTAHGDAIDIEAESVGQGEDARAQLHDIARFGEDQRFL